MNKIYDMGSNIPLAPEELAIRANALTRNKPFTPDMFEGPKSRISGYGHCNCNGDGEFELLPVYSPEVKEGEKRYMVCRKCGCYSHL